MSDAKVNALAVVSNGPAAKEASLERLRSASAVGADPRALGNLIIKNDLSVLSVEQRVDYYAAMCQHIGVDPVARPFEYLTLDGKLVLYATKGLAEQLRAKHGVSLGPPVVLFQGDYINATVSAALPNGRIDADIGVVSRIVETWGEDPDGKRRKRARPAEGQWLANLMMKAVTKAKRRVTFSILGLSGFLDEDSDELPGAAPAPFLPAQPPRAEALPAIAQPPEPPPEDPPEDEPPEDPTGPPPQKPLPACASCTGPADGWTIDGHPLCKDCAGGATLTGGAP